MAGGPPGPPRPGRRRGGGSKVASPADQPLAFQEQFPISRSYYIPLRGKAGVVGHISVAEPVTPKLPTLEMPAPLELFADLAALAGERAFQIKAAETQGKAARGVPPGAAPWTLAFLDFSTGLASYAPQNPRSPEELLREADTRLYDHTCSG
jgi:hypothetical protein